MRRLTVRDLVVPLVVIAAITYGLLRLSYASLPPFRYSTAVPLFALAAVEVIVARRVRLAVRHAPGARPMAAVVIARCVALGKASALVGSAAAGFAAGLLIRVVPSARTVDAALHDTRVGGLVLVSALLLMGAGLLLEHAGIDPNRDRDRDG